MQSEHNNEDLLEIEQNYIRADAGKRFLNYLIDVIVYYILMIGSGILLVLIAPSAVDSLANSNTGFAFFDRIISLFFYAIYMSIVETLLKGKSVGKYITGTRAVNLDGSRISSGTAFTRGFSRAVPFCVFSAFGTPCNPWQDRWSDTMVIDEKKSSMS